MDGPRLLREWRERVGKSQTSCAESIGVRQATWSDWESGWKSPQVKYAGRIAKLTEGSVPVLAWTDEADDVDELDKAVGQ